MDNDQSNCDSKRSVTITVAVLTGFIYSVGLTVFFGYVTIFSYYTYVFNGLAFILWILGMVKKSSRPMTLSLIFWGIFMHFCAICGFSSALAVFSNEVERNFYICVTALFAILYFTLIMTYLILKKLYQNTFENSQLILKEKISTQCWKCAAISIAWLIITIFHMIIFCALYVNLFSGTSKPIFAIALFLGVLNLVLTIVWWCLVNTKSTKYMLIPIIYWGLMLALWICIVAYVYVTEGHGHENFAFGFFIIFPVIVYSIAVMSFIEIMRTNRTQTMGILRKYPGLDWTFSKEKIENNRSVIQIQ